MAGKKRTPGLSVLLIRRLREPFAGHHALPGGFVEIDEPLEAAARRELAEETGITPPHLVPRGMYGDPGRDPRGRTISAVFRAVVWRDSHLPIAGDDAAAARWFSLRRLPPLAFDHGRIVRDAWESLRREVLCRPFGAELLPGTFRAEELAWVYRAVLERLIDANQLANRLQSRGVVRPPRRMAGESPSRDLQWNPTMYRKLGRTGFDCLDLGQLG